MKQRTLTRKQFEDELSKVNRFWNDETKRGDGRNQASEQLKENCIFIFIRNDGWSIASRYFEEAYNLWKGDWETIYELEQF